MTSNQRKVFIIIAIVLVSCICLAAISIAAGLLVFFEKVDSTTPETGVITETSRWIKPTILPTSGSSDATPIPTSTVSLDEGAGETYSTLASAEIPQGNTSELAKRFLGLDFIPEVVIDPDAPFDVGDSKVFWASNTETNQAFQVEALLAYETPHVYFWIEKGVSYNSTELKKLVDTFESKIYPTDREFFGSENTPGIDNDVHLYILHARGLGDAAGYYSSSNSEPPIVSKTSNAHEMFFLNADYIDFSEAFTYEVLAHEFQHMIHDYQDKNEVSWVNEGFSELAAFLNGYDPGPAASYFLMDPDIQLTDWPYDGDTYVHYGSSFLFMSYFLDRFGEDATQALVAEQKNDIQSVDEVLLEQGVKKADNTGFVMADDVFADWAVANYLNDRTIISGQYGYVSDHDLAEIFTEDSFYSCPTSWESRDVRQYGTDYLSIECDGSYTFSFEGQPSVKVVPQDPHSGKYAYWSNKGDNSDMWLQQNFDLTNVSGPISFSYWTWYQIEKDYDYLYLLASTDGQDWENLAPPSCTTFDPSGNSYGCAYNDEPDGWIQEEVDLSKYAGQKVTLRFEYVTDEAVNAEGFMLDDVAINAINYSSDFESDTGGWEAGGFVRIQNILPQTYRLSIIRKGTSTTVEQVEVLPGQSYSTQLEIGGDVEKVIVVISGTARFTRQPATYRYIIE